MLQDLDKAAVGRLMASLVAQNFANFGLLVQVVRQNLQNPENTDCMDLLLEKGFPALLELTLDDFVPLGVDAQAVLDLENAHSVVASLAQGARAELIQPQIKFFQTRKHRLLFLEVLLSLAAVKKPAMAELFFGAEQERRQFVLFKKLALWQALTSEPREQLLLDQSVCFLLFDSLPEAIIANKTAAFGLNRDLPANRRSGVLGQRLFGRGCQTRVGPSGLGLAETLRRLRAFPGGGFRAGLSTGAGLARVSGAPH